MVGRFDTIVFTCKFYIYLHYWFSYSKDRLLVGGRVTLGHRAEGLESLRKGCRGSKITLNFGTYFMHDHLNALQKENWMFEINNVQSYCCTFKYVKFLN